MDDQVIRNLLQNPKRIPIVIIATCGVSLLTVLPAVDEYVALTDHRSQLAQSLARAEQEVSELVALQQAAADCSAKLAEMKQSTLSESEIHSFRTEIVDMARQSGCRVRRIDLDQPFYRQWQNDDHPLMSSQAAGRSTEHEHRESPYRLRSQTMSLAIAGPLSGVNKLLEDLQITRRLMHARQLSLRPADESRSEVVMELEIQLFDLEIYDWGDAA